MAAQPPQHIIILGAGPCGLATAISLSKTSSTESPLCITLVETRPELSTIGGTIGLTPLAMRYLDQLGVGEVVRERSMPVLHGIDYISSRTGALLGNFWGNIGAVRIKRHDLVKTLYESLQMQCSHNVEVQWGRKVTEISEVHDQIILKFDDEKGDITGDVLLGCDGLHSAARRLYVEPSREKSYTGRVMAMGWGDTNDFEPDVSSSHSSPISLASGEPALTDTTIIRSSEGLLFATYYESTKKKVCFASLMPMDQPDSESRDGWKTKGKDHEDVREKITGLYSEGKVKGLAEFIDRCESWELYPIYILPGEGKWARGRVFLLGEAAHAMPPQGESTGLALEDAILFAHIFSRRTTRPIPQLFADYEVLRRGDINKHYNNAVWSMQHAFAGKKSWWMDMVEEWITGWVLLVKRWRQGSHFGGDVNELALPV